MCLLDREDVFLAGFDADAVFAAAARTGTALEIDAFPDPLDLKPRPGADAKAPRARGWARGATNARQALPIGIFLAGSASGVGMRISSIPSL